MIEVTRQVVEQALEGVGLYGENDVLHGEDVEIRGNYSGRGMYGAQCFGIVCNVGNLALFCASLGSFADDWDWVMSVRSDNMGRSTIWYWPDVRLVDGTVEERAYEMLPADHVLNSKRG